ncbi:HAD family hydrolase [uncultured Coprobacter sp.]|uniref:HAD family hydrolase n=1 Tax=uncultured Coprobacter sp. TaxID=1720550 RepID=UPI002625A01E|nr:HAD family hydrolase [uncultured Coprobacter sp.]
MIKLVIFDLDGTLLNTIRDLAGSTNYALRQCGFPEHETDAYNYFVGNGINKLFERALPEGERTSENIGRMRAFFLEHYTQNNTCLTVPYPGIPELLRELDHKGMALAVASNKYQEGTEKLVHHYFKDIVFSAVFGQREGIPVKPDPTIVKEILRVSGVSERETLYVGDSGVDMQTAAAATVISVGVTWGFRSREELIENGACHIVDSPAEILRLIGCL